MQRQPQQNPRHKAGDQSQQLQEGEVTKRSHKDHDTHDEESTSWGKAEQAAQDAANPQGKSKKATRKLLNKIQVWGAHARGRQWEQPVGVWWHMGQEQHALPWVYGGRDRGQTFINA